MSTNGCVLAAVAFQRTPPPPPLGFFSRLCVHSAVSVEVMGSHFSENYSLLEKSVGYRYDRKSISYFPRKVRFY